MTIPVKAVTPDKMEGTFDLFIYLAKQTYNDTAIPQMVAHSHKDTIICTGQNGLPELQVIKYWPKSQVCGAPVGWPATLLEPGVSRLTCSEDAPAFTFHLGTVDGPVTPWLLEVKKVLEKMCPVHLTENLMADRWAKVLVNSTTSGMSTVVNGTFGDAVNTDKGIECVVRIGREVVRVCHAQNIHITPLFGLDMDKLYDFTTPEEEAHTKEVIHNFFTKSEGKASMLQDLEKGRKCEISMINGVVAEYGDKVGVDTPYCDAVVKIVSEIEDGKRPLSSDNLKDMPSLPL